MVDREKVLTGLECCSVKQSCSGCPWAGLSCNDRLHLAALELLKEQEPVKPIRLENWWKCSLCGGNIVANMKHCPGCGNKVDWKAVKWDG